MAAGKQNGIHNPNRRQSPTASGRGKFVFATAFPGAAWIAAPNGTRELEMEIAQPEPGLAMQKWGMQNFA